MNPSRHLPLLSLLCTLTFLLGGCLINRRASPSAIISSRPCLRPTKPRPTPPLAVEVGFVKMPSYFLRNSLILRKSDIELDYLEDALWAERLDFSG